MRVLIFSADIGEGHDLPARVLREGILARCPEAEVTILDTLAAAGPVVRSLVRKGAETILERLPLLFEVQYFLIARFPPTRMVASRTLTAVAGRPLRKAIAARRPDVIVCTYPLANEVLGSLRLRHTLHVPVASAVTDLAALRAWAHPGCDLHLVIHPESAEEIRAIAGAHARVEPVRGLTSREFEKPADPGAARAALGLPAEGPVVVVSGGGWGVGALAGGVRAALAARDDTHVLALCGRNDRLRMRLAATFAAEPRVRVMGFTDRMADVLAGGDVLVPSTAGLTVFEALIRGMRVISYGWGVGHIRLNNRAYARFGLAESARNEPELRAAIERALASPGAPDLRYGDLPDASELVLALAGGGRHDPASA